MLKVRVDVRVDRRGRRAIFHFPNFFTFSYSSCTIKLLPIYLLRILKSHSNGRLFIYLFTNVNALNESTRDCIQKEMRRLSKLIFLVHQIAENFLPYTSDRTRRHSNTNWSDLTLDRRLREPLKCLHVCVRVNASES